MASVEITCPKCGRPTAGLRCTWCGGALGANPAGTSVARTEALSWRQDQSAIPAVLGRFRILARLAAGPRGIVYKAFDPVLQRDVALKVPQPAALGTPGARARFLDLAHSAAQLRHPNIVPILDAGFDGQHGYVVSSFIDGRSLQAAQRSGRRLEVRQAVQLILKLAEALDYAHRQGVVHRGVKPANILVDVQGEPHLMDFGLLPWDMEQNAPPQDLAQSDTPVYLAPEQAGAEVGPLGPASDQYSLGVVLYELLAAQVPFTGTPRDVLLAVRDRRPPRLRKLRSDLPRDLEAICDKALARQPSDRYPTCQALAADLRRWLQCEPILARRRGLAERCWSWTRHNPLPAALGGMAALVAGLCWLAAADLHAARQAAVARTAEAQHALALAQDDQTLAQEQRARAEAASLDLQALRDAADQQRRAAEAARAESETLRQAAEAALADAKAQRLLAEQQRDQAHAALAESETRLRLAEQRQAELLAAIKARADLVSAVPWFAYAETWLNYLATLEQAQRELAAGRQETARETLNGCTKEHRSWEWSYLRELAEGNPPTAWHYDCPAGLSALSIQFSPASTWLALLVGKRSSPGDTRVVLLELGTGQPFDLSALGAGRGASLVSFHPDEESLAIATPAGITLWALPIDKTTSRLRAVGRCSIARATAVALAPAAAELLVATHNGFYRCHAQTGAVLEGPWHLGKLVREPGSQERVETLIPPSQLSSAALPGSVSFNGSGDTVLVCAASYQGGRFDGLMKLAGGLLPLPAPDGHPALPAGSQLPAGPILDPDWSLAIGTGGVVTDLNSGKQLTRHQASAFTPVALSADGSRLLARPGGDAPLSVWDARQLKYGVWWKVMDLETAPFAPAAAVSRNWKHFASVASQGRVTVWRLP